MRPGAIAGTALAVAVACTAHEASASGLYFTDRGVRPMGRAGAFVAGADDLGAIWYNPAGLADAGNSVLVDASWLQFSVNYTRTLRVVNADGVVVYPQDPTVHGSSPVLPLPTVAWSWTIDPQKRFTLAGGVLAPYIALASYPDTVQYPYGPGPSPARYTLSSFDGSLLALPGLWIAYKPIEELRFGLGMLALIGWFQAGVTFSACPQDRLLCAPEQPEYDAAAQMRVGPIFAPSLDGGVTWVPSKWVRFGASGALPMVVNSEATFKVRMPSAAEFDNATEDGDKAHVRFVLPAIVRAGVEVRPADGLRVEAAWVHEFWSAHQSITAVPEGITIDGVTGLPPKLAVPPITIPRGFQDADSFRLGGEYHFKVGDYPLDARGGVAYETSAVPPAYLSLSSLDFPKWILSGGGSLYVGKHWRFDGVLAHVFAKSTYVNPDQAAIPRINPLPGSAPLEAVNGGTYAASANVIGLGLNYKF
ncbi:MAG TPA: outer membrane protein transport protein [Polyangiaceae bacterium]